MAWGPLILALLAGFLILIGVWFGGLKERSSSFNLPAVESHGEKAVVPMLHGVNVTEGVERGEIRIRLRNISVLSGIAALCVATLAAYWWAGVPYTATLDVDEVRYLVFYGLTYLGIVPLMVAAWWANECLLLRASAITVGLVQKHMRQPLLGLWTSYEFRDQHGEYFGGTSHNYDKVESDNLVFVFYVPASASYNAASCSLVFHRVELRVGGA
jgi:hypothetical protein